MTMGPSLEGTEFVIHENGTLRFHKCYAPVVDVVKRKILDEGHSTPHSVHPGRSILYKNLNQTFWWI